MVDNNQKWIQHYLWNNYYLFLCKFLQNFLLLIKTFATKRLLPIPYTADKLKYTHSLGISLWHLPQTMCIVHQIISWLFQFPFLDLLDRPQGSEQLLRFRFTVIHFYLAIQPIDSSIPFLVLIWSSEPIKNMPCSALYNAVI